jgi:DNA-binding MarR family transcriptional regulator
MTNGEDITSLLGQTFSKLYALNSIQEKEFLKGHPEHFHPTEIHFLELINKLDEANVTKLAEASQMTKGGVSKLTKKLLQQGAIESYQKSGNKKEIHFQLTALGQAFVSRHEQLHALWKTRDESFYAQFSGEELHTIRHFLESYKAHLEQEISRMDEKLSPIQRGDK